MGDEGSVSPHNGILWLSDPQGPLQVPPLLQPSCFSLTTPTASKSQNCPSLRAPLELSSHSKLSVFFLSPAWLLEQTIHLLSTGEGPVVHVHPSEINFGSIQVLQDASRSLHLSNQSVIPASFSAKMVSVAGAVCQCK